jgi:dUTP pyrophosphatase
VSIVHFKRLSADARVPDYATDGAAGMDICSTIETTLLPGCAKLIATGLAIELPYRYEAQVRPRSGLALKHRVTVLNAPGTIDEDYRGEIGVLLINHGNQPFVVKKGDRIAQLVIAKVERPTVYLTEELSGTARGDGGFGSTGVSENPSKDIVLPGLGLHRMVEGS